MQTDAITNRAFIYYKKTEFPITQSAKQTNPFTLHINAEKTNRRIEQIRRICHLIFLKYSHKEQLSCPTTKKGNPHNAESEKKGIFN